MCCNVIIVLCLPSSVHKGQLLELMCHRGKIRALQKTAGLSQRQGVHCRLVYIGEEKKAV